MAAETAGEQKTERAPRRRGRVAIVAAMGLTLAAAIAWFTTTDSFQLWRLDRQPTPELERAVQAHRNAPWPAYVLGGRYAEQGRLEEAMDLFERARNLEPSNYRPHFSMGLGFLRLGVPGAAVPELELAARLAPRDPRVLSYLGYALRESNRYRDAVNVGERAVALAPRNADAWYQLGLTYYRPTGQQGKGRECLKRAVELEPRNPGYRRDYASSLTDVGEYADAQREAREAVRLNPADPVALYLLGKILHRAHGSSEETVAMLEEAIRLSPNTFQPHYELGVVLQEKGDYAAALAEFQTSSRINPGHEQSWFHQANVLERLGRKELAAAARERFTRLTRDRDERQYLERRVFDHPEDAALRLRFAAVLERNEQLEAAAMQCQVILRKEPQHAPARVMLARLAQKAEQAAKREPAAP